MESPDKADAHLREGLRLASVGKVAEALKEFERGVALRPGNSLLQFNLGLACQQTRQTEKAVEAYRNAVAVSPDFFDAWNNLSVACAQTGNAEAAVAAAERALNLEPYNSAPYLHLGNALKARGDLEGADAAYQHALALENDPATPHLRAVKLLERQNQLSAAWSQAKAAIEKSPHHPHAQFCLGNIPLIQGRAQEALTWLQRAVEQAPQCAEYWAKIGQAHLHRNAPKLAVEAFGKALNCDAEFSDARYGMAWAELLMGNLSRGWAAFERRWNAGGLRYTGIPAWTGESLEDRDLLVYSEQGFGEAIFYARYLPLLARRGAALHFECAKPLARLLSTVACVASVVPFGDPIPDVDYQVSVFSLPRLFGTTLENIPNQIPYVRASAEVRVELPPAPADQFKVGLVWAGSRLLLWGQSRSVPLKELAPVISVAGAVFYSLQLGKAKEQIGELPFGSKIIDLQPHLVDFAATAAAIDRLDLVITVDTSVAHLAGALGKTVWLMLPFAPDWRWMLDRADSPWYPTMRLFRPKKRDDWASITRSVREALTQWIGAPGNQHHR